MKNFISKLNYHNAIAILAGALLLCYLAFLNTYPLVYFDSGTYIDSGFKNFFPIDRPVFYGWFIRHISMCVSLWFVVFLQGIICSYLIFRTIKALTGSTGLYIKFFSIIAVLVLCSAVSQKVSILTPDIFTPFVFMSILVLVIDDELKKIEKISISVILFYSIIVHNSHAYILILFFLIAFLLCVFKKQNLFKITYKKALIIFAIFISALITVPTTNYFLSGHFKFSRGGTVFLMGKLIANGIVEDYLKDNCGKHNFTLCPYKDGQLRHLDFLWDWQRSPLYKTGGWDANELEYSYMINDMLTSPKYLNLFLINSFQQSIAQFFNYAIIVSEENPEQLYESSPYFNLKMHLPHELNNFIASSQNRKLLNYTYLNKRHELLMIFCFAASGLIFLVKQIRASVSNKLKSAIALLYLFLIANATVCATVSFIVPRYQNRISWLLILLILLVIFELPFFKKYYSKVDC